jgi:hypothetical protein
VNLPPGFELEQPRGTVTVQPTPQHMRTAQLPAGFELEAPKQAPQAAPTPRQQADQFGNDVAERINPIMGLLYSVLPREKVQQGLTLGFGDEITAALKGALGDNYDAALQAERDKLAKAEKDSPVASVVGEVTGALLTAPFMPAAKIFQGANIASRAANAAATGAGIGGVYGFGQGEGNVQNRVNSSVNTAAVGALTGGIGAPLIEGIVAGTRALTRPFRGLANPELEANRRVVRAIEKDNPNTPNAANVAADTMDAYNAQGVPMMVGDMGRGHTLALARSASDTSPAARDALQPALNDRFATQSDRITKVVRSLFNGADPNAPAAQEALQIASRKANRPAYLQAQKDAEKVALWTPELQELVQAPEVQNAIRVALPQLRNWAVADGLKAPIGAFQIENGRTVLRQTQAGNEILPSLQLWDYVKRALDKNGSPTAKQFAEALRTQLDELVPSYGTARAGAAKFFGAQDMMEAGQNFVMSSVPIKEAQIALAKATPQEREIFRYGFASDLLDKIAKVSDRRNLINSIYQSPDAKQRINIALGPQGAQKIEAAARLENILNALKDATQGNSKTSQFLMDLGIAGGVGAGGLFGGFDGGTTTATAIAAILARRSRGMVDQRVAQKVGELLASNDPQKLRQAYEMVSRNSTLMEAVRRAENDVSRLAIPSAPQVTPQNVLPAAAEQDQNNRPR